MIDTAGQYHPLIDTCAYCEMDTGGNHQWFCPCNPHSIQFQLYEQGIIDLREGKYKPLKDIKKEASNGRSTGKDI